MKAARFVVLGKSNTPEFGITCVTESRAERRLPRIRGTPSRTPGGCRAAPRPRSPRGAAARARLGRRRSIRIPASAAASSGSSRRAAASPPPIHERLPRALAERAALGHGPDAAALLRRLAGYEAGDAHWAPPPGRPFLDEVGADPGRLRIAFTAEPAILHRARSASRPGCAQRRGRTLRNWATTWSRRHRRGATRRAARGHSRGSGS